MEIRISSPTLITWISKVLISENALPKRDAVERQGRDYVISPISDSGTVEPLEKKNGRFTTMQAERIRHLVKEGMSETWARRTVLADGHPLDCECEVCLRPSNAPTSQGKLMKGA